MRRTGSAKARCWSANSSGVQTVASSVGSTLSSYYSASETRHTDALRLSALGCDDDDDDDDKELDYRARNTVADAATRPQGLTPDMMDAVIRLAETTGDKLICEAEASLRTPMKRKHIRMLSCVQGVELYANVRPTPVMPPHTTKTPPQPKPKSGKFSFPRSLWNRLTRRRTRPARAEPSPSTPAPEPPMQHVPRVFGRTQVHVPLDELIDLVGHRSAHATALLHPAMDRSDGLQHSLIDLVNEHVCLRSMTLPALAPTAPEPRDFLMFEYHRAFRAASGRRGYVVACHSVHWTNGPSPPRRAVRGSMYESGLVAIESDVDSDRVDLYSVAELNLKGTAGEDENFDASHRRVLGVLERITRTIEERAKMLLSLDHTHVFHKARRAQGSRCESTCADCKQRLGTPAPGTEPFACRKCYVHVCGDCSSIWTRGQKDMRLCMECWADATLNRTCASVQDDSFLRFL